MAADGVYVTWHELVVVAPTWARVHVVELKLPAAPATELAPSRANVTVPWGKLLVPLSVSDTTAVQVLPSLRATGLAHVTTVLVVRLATVMFEKPLLVAWVVMLLGLLGS